MPASFISTTSSPVSASVTMVPIGTLSVMSGALRPCMKKPEAPPLVEELPVELIVPQPGFSV